MIIEDIRKGKFPARQTAGPAIPQRRPAGKRGTIAMNDDQLFVEKREQGDYAIRKANSQRASAVEPTQKAAIARARGMSAKTPLVERVRNTSAGGRDQWRRP
jgi:hypothetical protein